MSHYLSNLRDIEFNLFEVLDRGRVLGRPPFAGVDPATARSILAEMERLATDELAASFVDGDRNPPVFDSATHTAPLSRAFKDSYEAWIASGFWRLNLPEEIGGTPAPATLYWAIGELVLGSNPAIWMYGGGPFFAGLLHRLGNERDHQIAKHMMERRWSATMVLTEPDVGSDVGAARTKATANEDGSWNITGVKRFITSAESDIAEQIVHFVLARPVDVDGAGGPGTKGLSLFVVPQFDFDLDTGELGERNGVFVTQVERKMGIKVSNTCEVTFGDPGVGNGAPARGWLLGEVHHGIAQMFHVIENARMMVGTKAIATLSTGYLNALEHVRQRQQETDTPVASDDTARNVRNAQEADLRRSLLLQKSHAEAMRALVLYTASRQDDIQLAEHAGDGESASHHLNVAVNDLLLPIVKGYGSERSWVLLGTESLQTYGESGLLQENPVEQYVRDAKIDTLYEGTTAIQGQDFFFRKIVKDQGRALGAIAAEIQAFLDSDSGNGRLKSERLLLATALDDANAIVGHMVDDLMSAQEEIRNIYKVGLNTSRVLMVLGDVVCAWLLLRGAEVALDRLGGAVSDEDEAFYEGKVAAARFFAANVLPRITPQRAIAESTDLDLMDLSDDSF